MGLGIVALAGSNAPFHEFDDLTLEAPNRVPVKPNFSDE